MYIILTDLSKLPLTQGCFNRRKENHAFMKHAHENINVNKWHLFPRTTVMTSETELK